MESKKINKLLIGVSIFLGVTFIGCLLYSFWNPWFNFSNTISSISSFFVAVLTIIYVYTTSKQMDFMKQQLEQMQREQRLSEQPILDLVSLSFEIERPRFYYTPPADRYSYLSRHIAFLKINNVSNYAAMFVDITAQLIVEEGERLLALETVSERINVIAANSTSTPIDIMFPGDRESKIMAALRSYSALKLPKIKIIICYKSLSGANYQVEHTYLLDIENEENAEILKNWHTTLVSAPIEEKETLEMLKKTSSVHDRDELFYYSKENFDKKLMGGETLPLRMIEIPQEFTLRVITDKEFNDEIKKHQYSRYVGSYGGSCMSARRS